METLRDFNCPICRKPWKKQQSDLGVASSHSYPKKKNVEILCSDHQEKMTMWCKTCDKIVCSPCVVSHHGGHHFELLENAGPAIERSTTAKVAHLTTINENNFQLLAKRKCEIEKTIEILKKFEEKIHFEKENFQNILKQLSIQQRGEDERMDKLKTINFWLTEKDQSYRQNLLLQCQHDLDLSPKIQLKPQTLPDSSSVIASIAHCFQVILKSR